MPLGSPTDGRRVWRARVLVEPIEEHMRRLARDVDVILARDALLAGNVDRALTLSIGLVLTTRLTKTRRRSRSAPFSRRGIVPLRFSNTAAIASYCSASSTKNRPRRCGAWFWTTTGEASLRPTRCNDTQAVHANQARERSVRAGPARARRIHARAARRRSSRTTARTRSGCHLGRARARASDRISVSIRRPAEPSFGTTNLLPDPGSGQDRSTP